MANCYEWSNGTGTFWSEDDAGRVIPGSIYVKAQPLLPGPVLEGYFYDRSKLYRARAFLAGLMNAAGA